MDKMISTDVTRHKWWENVTFYFSFWTIALLIKKIQVFLVVSMGNWYLLRVFSSPSPGKHYFLYIRPWSSIPVTEKSSLLLGPKGLLGGSRQRSDAGGLTDGCFYSPFFLKKDVKKTQNRMMCSKKALVGTGGFDWG